MRHQSKILWAKGEAIPEISRLIDERNWVMAFKLAEQAEKYIAKDSMLIELWPGFSGFLTIYSEPQGTKVYCRPYKSEDEQWKYLGETPLDSIRFPFGSFRLRLKKEGYLTMHAGNYSSTMVFKLDKEDTIPRNMVFIPGGEYWTVLPGFDHLGEIELEDYLIDKYEVTNRQYKEFIDNGGYEKQEYWKHEFIREGKVLTWEEATAEFHDATDRPGPSTWEVGDYPDGMDDYPVTGVSWYEAAAYAEFAKKGLPTLYHWNVAANKFWSADIIPLSNFDGQGPSPVGTYQGLSPYGSYDMAGNVREWCWNESSGQRLILGGGWNDNMYMFTIAYAQLPFDRSESNGFRCIQYLGQPENREFLEKPVELLHRDFLNEPKVSDEIFAVFLKQYLYDKTDLNVVIGTASEEENYIREKISFDAAYGNERIMAYLFLPKHGTPPYQTVVYFPGSGAMASRSSENLGINELNRIFIKSGRAVLYPIYKSTYERGDGFDEISLPNESHIFKEHVIMWVKDMSRSIDYLETRDDIDTRKLAYCGYSWGGVMGGIIPAVERRFKTSVLVVPGLFFQRSLPEVDPIHYLPRITIPVLMLNGKYDYLFPYEYSQLPFYKLLGTPREHKELYVYEYAHYVPRTELTREILDWLDNYLGPVND
jgi:dienelactone hydrolase